MLEEAATRSSTVIRWAPSAVWRRLTSSCSSASSCIEHTIPISSQVARTSCGTNSGPL